MANDGESVVNRRHPKQQWPQFQESPSDTEERNFRWCRLALALRLFGRLGFEEGVAGHISYRDPKSPDLFWVNPFGVPFSQVRASDLLLVDRVGTVVQGTGRVNIAAIAIHGAVLAARDDVASVAHAHSMYGKAWSSLRRLLDPITQDSCVFHGDHALVPYGGLALDGEEGRRIAAGLGGCKAAILENHGLLTVGATVDEAAWWFVAMERACQAQILAESVGRPCPLPEELVRDAGGGPLTESVRRFGWSSFQVLVDSMPDLTEDDSVPVSGDRRAI